MFWILHSKTMIGYYDTVVWIQGYCSCKRLVAAHTFTQTTNKLTSFYTITDVSYDLSAPFTTKMKSFVQYKIWWCSQILKLSTFWQAQITFNHQIVTELSSFKLVHNNCSVGEVFMAFCSCKINTMYTVISLGYTFMRCSRDIRFPGKWLPGFGVLPSLGPPMLTIQYPPIVMQRSYSNILTQLWEE